MSQFFTSAGQSIGVLSTLVLPMNIQDWSPLGWTGWISLQSKGKEKLNNWGHKGNMEALPVLPSLPELLTLLVRAPLLPTCSFFVSIDTLHKIHTCLVCLIETAHQPQTPGTCDSLAISATAQVWLVATYFSISWSLTQGFLPLVDSSCRWGKSCPVLCGECYTQLFPRGECHTHALGNWGQTQLPTHFNHRPTTPHASQTT